MQIEIGKKVTVQYTLFDANGQELDSSYRLGPLTFVCGQKQVLPALEIALAGMKPGDSKKIKLAAKDAYGTVQASAFKNVDLALLPEDSRQPNAILGFFDEQGQSQQVKVHEIKGDQAVLDFNHPLADMDLVFDVLIVDVEQNEL